MYHCPLISIIHTHKKIIQLLQAPCDLVLLGSDHFFTKPFFCIESVYLWTAVHVFKITKQNKNEDPEIECFW